LLAFGHLAGVEIRVARRQAEVRRPLSASTPSPDNRARRQLADALSLDRSAGLPRGDRNDENFMPKGGDDFAGA